MGTSVISWKCIAFNVIKEKKKKTNDQLSQYPLRNVEKNKSK